MPHALEIASGIGASKDESTSLRLSLIMAVRLIVDELAQELEDLAACLSELPHVPVRELPCDGSHQWSHPWEADKQRRPCCGGACRIGLHALYLQSSKSPSEEWG